MPRQERAGDNPVRTSPGSEPPPNALSRSVTAARIRSNLQRSSRRLREVISAPDFEALFGPARPHPKGERQNIFGMEDELKVAPKGIDKTHKCAHPLALIHVYANVDGLSRMLQGHRPAQMSLVCRRVQVRFSASPRSVVSLV